MMKYLRHAVLSLCSALALGCAVLSVVAQPLLHFVSVGCERLSCGLTKLERDLAHMRDAMATGVGEGVSDDLKKEGHGYRQSSASESFAQMATASPAMA